MPTFSQAEEESKKYEGFEAEMIMLSGEILNTIWETGYWDKYDQDKYRVPGHWEALVLLRKPIENTWTEIDTGVYLCSFASVFELSMESSAFDYKKNSYYCVTNVPKSEEED